MKLSKMSSNAFLLDMCMGCLNSDCELNEGNPSEDTDYINLANDCFPELEVIFYVLDLFTLFFVIL